MVKITAVGLVVAILHRQKTDAITRSLLGWFQLDLTRLMLDLGALLEPREPDARGFRVIYLISVQGALGTNQDRVGSLRLTCAFGQGSACHTGDDGQSQVTIKTFKTMKQTIRSENGLIAGILIFTYR